MDLNTLTNLVLLVCLGIFIVVLAYRALSGLAARPRYPKAEPIGVRYIGKQENAEPQVLDESPVYAPEQPPAPEEAPVAQEWAAAEEAQIPEEIVAPEQPEVAGPAQPMEERARERPGPAGDVAGMERPMPRKPKAFPSMLATELLSRAADEDAEAIRTIAGELIDYSVARGGVSNVRPEVLEKLALQFGMLEMALRKASAGPEGAPRVIPEDLRSDLFREAFRLLASQARR